MTRRRPGSRFATHTASDALTARSRRRGWAIASLLAPLVAALIIPGAAAHAQQLLAAGAERRPRVLLDRDPRSGEAIEIPARMTVGFQPGQEVAALNNATIYLHALERGYVVLTRNLRDFDIMNQIVPSGRVLFYRTV